jgi:hypothetical protein
MPRRKKFYLLKLKKENGQFIRRSGSFVLQESIKASDEKKAQEIANRKAKQHGADSYELRPDDDLNAPRGNWKLRASLKVYDKGGEQIGKWSFEADDKGQAHRIAKRKAMQHGADSYELRTTTRFWSNDGFPFSGC